MTRKITLIEKVDGGWKYHLDGTTGPAFILTQNPPGKDVVVGSEVTIVPPQPKRPKKR